MLYIVLFVALVIFAGYYLGQRSVGKEPNLTEQPKNVWNRFTSWGEGLFSNGHKQGTESIQAWVAKSDLPADMKTWLAGLSAEELSKFNQALTQFANQSHFDLTALTDEGMKQYAAPLQKTIKEAVKSYAIAYWKAIGVQEDVAVFEAFQAWNANPASRSGRELSEVLFAKLLGDGLISAEASSRLITASAKERQEYVIQAIRDYANGHSDKFFAILKDVLHHRHTAKTKTKEVAKSAEEAVPPVPAV
jgi:hypothetical protein